MNKIISIIILLVVIVGGIFLYRSRSNNMDMSDTTGTDTGASSAVVNVEESGSVQGTVTVTAPSVKSFTVTGSSFSFAPNTLTVNKGDTVKIHFVNSGGSHDFVLDEFNAKTPVIASGQSADVTFVANKSGTFEYYCSVGTHRQMGMKGTLTVK